MRATGDTDVNDLTRAQSLQSGHIVFRLSAPHANGAEPVFNRVKGVHKLHCVLMQSSYASCGCIFASFVCIFATSVYIYATCVFTLCAGEKEVYVRPPPGLPGEPHSFHSVPSRTAGHDESRARRHVWWKSAGAGDCPRRGVCGTINQCVTKGDLCPIFPAHSSH